VKTLVLSNNWKYLQELEKSAIAAFRTEAPAGYNLTLGGDGFAVRAQTEEHRAKTSAALKLAWASGRMTGTLGKKMPDGMGAKVSAALKGKPKPERTKEHAAKIAASLKSKNIRHTEEMKQAISAKLKGRYFSEEHRRRLREAWVLRKQKSIIGESNGS